MTGAAERDVEAALPVATPVAGLPELAVPGVVVLVVVRPGLVAAGVVEVAAAEGAVAPPVGVAAWAAVA
jgi:hypothetical protein